MRNGDAKIGEFARWTKLLFATLVACGGRSHSAASPRTAPSSYAEYTVVGMLDGSAQVSGRFEHVSPELSLPLLGDSEDIVVEGSFERLSETRLLAPACARSCTFRYTVKDQSSKVLSSTKLLLMPEANRPREAKVLVRGHAASALFGHGEVRTLLFEKTREGAPFVFGPTRHKTLGEGLELTVVSPAKFRNPEMFDTWVKEAYGGVASLYGKAPVKMARIFLRPVEGHDHPLFGQALTLSGPAVTLLVGTETPASELRKDWTLVHEMIHLGFPTIIGGRYWMEGLSTYFEPIVRARLRWYSAKEAWGELYRGMDDVLPTPPLAESTHHGINATYWGGAALMLLCDVELRLRTGRSLEQLLQQNLLRGRTSTDELTVDAALRELDGPAGGQGILGEFFRRHAFGREPLPISALFAKLGVQADGTSDRAAPLAAIRESIMNAP